MINLSIIPDEISHDPFTALEFARKWGLENVELRYAYRFRLPVCPQWVTDRTRAAVEAYGMTVTAVSPGLFKPIMNIEGSKRPVGIEYPDEIDRHINELLPRCMDYAQSLGTDKITLFGLPRSENNNENEGVPSIVIDSLGRMTDKAAAAGMTLLLENGGGTYADSADNTLKILSSISGDKLKATWDPANIVYAGFSEAPAETGYRKLHSYVRNVHVKDALTIDGHGRWVQFSAGSVNWREQLNALLNDNYKGYLTLEPHLQYESSVNLVGTIEEFVKRVKQFQASNESAKD